VLKAVQKNVHIFVPLSYSFLLRGFYYSVHVQEQDWKQLINLTYVSHCLRSFMFFLYTQRRNTCILLTRYANNDMHDGDLVSELHDMTVQLADCIRISRVIYKNMSSYNLHGAQTENYNDNSIGENMLFPF